MKTIEGIDWVMEKKQRFMEVAYPHAIRAAKRAFRGVARAEAGRRPRRRFQAKDVGPVVETPPEGPKTRAAALAPDPTGRSSGCTWTEGPVGPTPANLDIQDYRAKQTQHLLDEAGPAPSRTNRADPDQRVARTGLVRPGRPTPVSLAAALELAGDEAG